MGGKRAPSAFNRNDGIGTSRSGKILEWALQQQRDISDGSPKTWPNGDPMNHLAVTVQTDLRDATIPDDNGIRTFYIKGEMHKAVKQAILAAGEKFIAEGGILTIVYVADGTAAGVGLNPPKLYKAHYLPPAAAFLTADETAAQNALTEAGLAHAVTPATPAGASTATSAPAQSQSAGTGPAVPPGTNPALAAALAAMTDEERAAALLALKAGD